MRSQILEAAAAADFLQEQQSWQLFVTVTNAWNPGWEVTAGTRGYRDRKPSHCDWFTAERRFRRGMNRINRAIWGRHWHRRSENGIVWGGTCEPQRSGNPHFHALLTTPLLHLPNVFTDRKQLGRKEVIPTLEKHFQDAGCGYSRVEIIRDPETVAAYCTKYVTKAGGLQVGGPWETPHTPALASS